MKPFWVMAAAVFGADRLVKLWAQARLAPGGWVQGIEGVFRWVYAENTGAAFSFMADQSWIHYLITPIFFVVGWLLLRSWRLGLWPRLCLGAIVGGALGNYADRLLYGYVIDMIDVTFMRFAVFNLADVAICLGGGLLAVSLVLRNNDWRHTNDGKTD